MLCCHQRKLEVTKNDRSTTSAGPWISSPDCVARTVTRPVPVTVRLFPLTKAGPEAMPSVTGSPELATANSRMGAPPKGWSGRAANAMDCERAVTVRSAELDATAGPTVAETTHLKRCPCEANVGPLTVSIEELVPEYVPPSVTAAQLVPPSVLTCQEKPTVPVPAAVTEKLAPVPATTVAGIGWTTTTACVGTSLSPTRPATSLAVKLPW